MSAVATITRVELEAEQFERDGLVVLDTSLPGSVVERMRKGAFASLSRLLARIEARTSRTIGVGMGEGFAEIVQRAPGRFDLAFQSEESAREDRTLDQAPWTGLLERLLGPEPRLLYRGVLIAVPGAAEQTWHADGEHLVPGFPVHLPPHCLNVFVPLVDLTRENGATEFCPGSHRLTGAIADLSRQDPELPARIGYGGRPSTPLLTAGSALLFDYRLVHRGVENRSREARPVLYLTYARPWFCDVRSFPGRSLTTSDG